MKRFHCFALGVLLLTAQAEKEDFQGYHTRTVTRDVLLKKENTTGHGAETIQMITKASTVMIPTSDFSSSFGETSLKPTSAESETTLISIHDKINSTRAASDAVMHGASEPEVSPSAEAATASLWLHTRLDNGNQRNTDSITLTSADRGPGVPILSASHPRVIDNPAVLRNGNDDKRSRGEDDKGISNLGRNEYPLSTVQSVFRISDTAEDSVDGNTLTNLCLTCQEDRRVAASSDKSVPALSPDGTADSLSIEGLALDVRQFTTSLPGLHLQSAGEQEEMPNIHQQNIGKQSSVGAEEQLVYNLTFPPLSLNKNGNHSQSGLKNSHILSDAGTVGTRSLAEMSTATQEDTKNETLVTERPLSTTTALHRSSKSLSTARKQEEVNTGDPKMYFKNASHSLSTNFRNVFVQSQPLDYSSGPVNNLSDLSESPTSSVHPEGCDHSITATNPTARPGSIEAYSAIASVRVRRPTTSPVKHTESHSLTGSDDPLISALRSQTAKPSSKSKDAILTLLLKKSERILSDEQESQTFNSIVKPDTVDPSGALQTPTFTTRKVVAPVTFSGSRRDTLTRATRPSKSFPERFLVSQSKLTPETMLNDSNHNYVAPTRQLFVKYNRDLIRESLIVPDLKAGDKNERVAEEDEDREGEEIKETKKKLQESRDGEKSGNKREELFRSDKTQNGEGEKIIKTGAKMHKKTEREAEARREEGVGTVTEEDGALRHEEDAEKQTKEGASEEEIRREDVTNVPVGPTTNSTEINQGHTITNVSSCLSLIKQFGAPEHKGIHPGDKTLQIMEMKNKPFSYEVTSNHRPPHSTPSSPSPPSPRLSRITSSPKEPRTPIKPRPSARGAATLAERDATSSLPEESARNKVVKFSVKVPKLSPAFGVSVSTSSDAPKPTVSPQSGATKSAHPALKSISNTPSLTASRLAITAELLRAQTRFRVNTLSVSIIYRVSDHRHKFSASDSKGNSLLQHEREQAEHIIPAPILDSSVKEPLTSNIIEEVNTSATSQQMYNDLATRPPTAAALSSVAHTSIGHPPQRQSAPQTSRSSSSSSSDMTPGQPCSFRLSGQTAHSDALHAPVDDNERGSVRDLMTSMSPKAKNDQFPLSGVSPLPNLAVFGDDSLPGTYSPTGLTRSASEGEISRADADAGYANSGGVRSESLLGPTDEATQTEVGDSEQKTATSGVKHAYTSTKQRAHEKTSSASVEHGKHHARSTVESSLSLLLTEKLAAENTNEDNDTDLFTVDGSDAENSATLDNNRLPPLGSYDETTPHPGVSAVQTAQNTEQAVNDDFVPVANDLAIPALYDTNDPTGTAAFVESESRPEIPQIQSNDVTNNAIPGTGSHAAKTAEKQHDPSTSPSAPVDLKAPNISTEQITHRIMNATSGFQITTKTNDFTSPAPTAGTSVLIVSAEAHESALTASVRVVTEKSSRAAQAERTVQSGSRIEPLSLTATTGKLAPAVNTTESLEQPEHEISAQAIEQNQHAPPGMIAITRPSSDPGPSVREGLLKAAHGAGAAASTERVKYSSFKHITTPTTKSAFEVRYPPREMTHTVHTPRKTSISQVVLGAVTDSVPPAGITPTEIINKASCGTIGCAKSSETNETTTGAGEIDHTAREKTQAGNTGGDNFHAAHTPDTIRENGSSSAERPAAGKATPQAAGLDHAALSPVKSHHGRAAFHTATKNVKSLTDETSRRALVEMDHLERRRELEPGEKTTQRRRSHRRTSTAQEAAAAEVAGSDPEATAAQTATEQTLLPGKKIKTQLNRGAAKAEIFEAQNATGSARAVAKAETAVQASGGRLKTESELNHIRRTSSLLYLSGVTEVSDDLCGSGNYTAEMSLNLGRAVEPGDAVPALANLRVVINLKTNNSRINLGVTSCCLSPTVQADFTNSTCCLFSRLAAEPAGITLLPSALSTSASFTITLFRMINYSVAYLHCDLSVCPRNRSGCERQCLQQRSAFPSEGPEAAGLRNRISFGPMLKEVKNSTVPEEIDPSELDLVLVIISLAVGSSLVTVMLMLVWLAYRRRAIWPLHSAAPPRTCCGCLHPGGDSILP